MASANHHAATPVQDLMVFPGDKITEFLSYRRWFDSFTAQGTHLSPNVRETLRRCGMSGPPPEVFEEYERLASEQMCLLLVKKPLNNISDLRDKRISWKRTANIEMLLETALIVLDSLPVLPAVMRSGLHQILAHALSTVAAQYDELRCGSDERRTKISDLRNTGTHWVSLSFCFWSVVGFNSYMPNYF